MITRFLSEDDLRFDREKRWRRTFHAVDHEDELLSFVP